MLFEFLAHKNKILKRFCQALSVWVFMSQQCLCVVNTNFEFSGLMRTFLFKFSLSLYGRIIGSYIVFEDVNSTQMNSDCMRKQNLPSFLFHDCYSDATF